MAWTIALAGRRIGQICWRNSWICRQRQISSRSYNRLKSEEVRVVKRSTRVACVVIACGMLPVILGAQAKKDAKGAEQFSVNAQASGKGGAGEPVCHLHRSL